MQHAIWTCTDSPRGGQNALVEIVGVDGTCEEIIGVIFLTKLI